MYLSAGLELRAVTLADPFTGGNVHFRRDSTVNLFRSLLLEESFTVGIWYWVPDLSENARNNAEYSNMPDLGAKEEKKLDITLQCHIHVHVWSRGYNVFP